MVHLFNNISVIVLSGYLLERWLEGKSKLFWYLFPLFTSTAWGLISLIMEDWPSVGASFWIVGQSLLLALHYARKGKAMKLDSDLDVLCVLVCGYCALSSVYSHLASLVVFPFDNRIVSLSIGHLLFVGFFVIALRSLSYVSHKTGFLRNALVDLGLDDPYSLERSAPDS